MRSSRSGARGGGVDRRDFLRGAAATAGLGLGGGLVGCAEDEPAFRDPGGFEPGPVRHLLPGAGPHRIVLKASFSVAFPEPPVLRLRAGDDEHEVRGRRTDADGRFFAFDARDLRPGTQWTLRLHEASGAPLCDAWPLRTLPHPDAEPERVRILAYTCAGGPDLRIPWSGESAWVPIALRRRMLARALSFEPDLVLAIGDHVYWDVRSRTGRLLGGGPIGWWRAGLFDRDAAVLGTENEQVLRRAVGPQIAGLYGTMFRSVPCFFVRDDHDYFENDEANDELRTFPADRFMRDAARASQLLYYPELITDDSVPAARRGANGLAESFGSARWGRLFEALLYDCRGRLANARDPATPDAVSGFVPPDVEAWLLERTLRGPARHLLHVPSTPVLWTAGKWGEWYPDEFGDGGSIGQRDKARFWPEGWKAQHDRLVQAVAGRTDRIPLFASGDLHATALGRIVATGGEPLAQPVTSLLCGTPGAAGPGWPSRARGQRPVASGTIRAEEWVEPLEENGFSLLDVTRDAIEVSLFRWLPTQGRDALDTLTPFAHHRFARA